MQSHACTRSVSDLRFLFFSSLLPFSLFLSSSIPRTSSTVAPLLTCRECVPAIAACTDTDTPPPRAEARKEVFNIDESPLPLVAFLGFSRPSSNPLPSVRVHANLYRDAQYAYRRAGMCTPVTRHHSLGWTVSAIQPRSISSSFLPPSSRSLCRYTLLLIQPPQPCTVYERKYTRTT